MSGNEELALGDILDGKYIIEELIGRGGMGAVYRARHVELGSPRAIKIMRRELAQDASFVRRFRNEPLLAEGVRHPNVVSVYDFSTLDDGTSYIVWEYVEGNTLAQLLTKGNVFTSSEVVNFVEQVADGLSAVHEKGILHRDVSPDNIMICTDARGSSNVKLLDFGVAKGGGIPGETPADASMLFGKIGYASPEQMGLLQDDELLDGRTDVFSLAAVAYTMLTGESPFRTASLQVFVHDLIIAPESEIKARYLESLPEPWRAPLSRALARDREARPATTNAFAEEIKKAAKAMGSEGSSIQQPEAGAPRWRGVLFASAVAAAIVAIAVAVTTTTRDVIRTPVKIGEPSAKGRQAFPDETVGLAEPAIAELPQREEVATELAPEPSRSVVAPIETEPSREREDAQAGPVQIAVPMEDERNRVEEAGVDSTPGEPPAAEPKHPNPIDDKMAEGPSERPQPPAPAPPGPQPKTATTVIQPRLVFQKEPVYTDMAKRLRIQGDVILKAMITSQGNVTDIEVVRSLPHLDGAAIEAARQWKYEPALRDGVAVPYKMDLKVTFRFTP